MQTEKRELPPLGLPAHAVEYLLARMKTLAYSRTRAIFEHNAGTVTRICDGTEEFPDEPISFSLSKLTDRQAKRLEDRSKRFVEKISTNGLFTYKDFNLSLDQVDPTNNIAESTNSRVQRAIARNRYRADTLVMRISLLMENDEKARQVAYWLERGSMQWTPEARALGPEVISVKLVTVDTDASSQSAISIDEEEDEENDKDDTTGCSERIELANHDSCATSSVIPNAIADEQADGSTVGSDVELEHAKEWFELTKAEEPNEHASDSSESTRAEMSPSSRQLTTTPSSPELHQSQLSQNPDETFL